MEQKLHKIIKKGCTKAVSLQRTGEYIMGIKLQPEIFQEMVDEIMELVEEEEGCA